MSQKLSKKELKQDDGFVAFGNRVMAFFAENLWTVLVGLTAGLVLVASFFGWLHKRDLREVEASGRMAQAEKLVGGQELELGGRRFPAMPVTDEGTLRKALQDFEVVSKEYPGTAAARRADLQAGDTYLKLREWDRAAEAYGKVKGGETVERYYALSGLGHALEGKGAYDDAAQAYRTLSEDKKSSYLRDLSTLDLARALKEAGKADQARAVLAGFDGDDKDLRDSNMKSVADRELASLGLPTSGAPAPAVSPALPGSPAGESSPAAPHGPTASGGAPAAPAAGRPALDP